MQLNSGLSGPSTSACDCKRKESLKHLNGDREKEAMEGQKEDDMIQITKTCMGEEKQAKRRQTDLSIESGQKCLAHSDNEEKDTSQTCLCSRCESEATSNTSHLAEKCGQVQLTFTNVETEEQQPQITAAFSLSDDQETVERKRRRLSGHGSHLPLESCKSKSAFNMDSLLSTCEEMVVPEEESLGSNVKKVQLVLFGSTSQETCSLIDDGKRQVSPAGTEGLLWPPEVLSVDVGAQRENSSSTVPKGRNSIKLQLHEQWKRCYHPPQSSRRSKLKAQTHTAFSSSVKPTNTQKLLTASKKSIWSVNRNANCRLSLKRRRVFLSGQLKEREPMKEQDGVREPEDRMKMKGHQKDAALQENVLKFKVLPNTFCFRDGFNEKKQTSDSVSNKPVLDKGKHKDSGNTVKGKGEWFPPHSEKGCLRPKIPAPKTSGLFHEFQRKYKKMTKPSVE
ncbi:uncharacterized protein si:ch211-106e7.2 [Brachionichthys hirsutus]|uniref:uncharacterized protein si:ch211-106e7.2 n=1 Tax=Brachionichthys hirsutus TaxID=412623 RepID=UPI003605255D